MGGEVAAAYPHALLARPHRCLGSARSLAAILGVAASLASAPALAQSPLDASIERFEAPEGCTGPDAFVARLEALGAQPGTIRMSVEVTMSWAGLHRGVVVFSRPDALPVERVIEDDVCADVLDALAISAGLFLREPPPAEPLSAAPVAALPHEPVEPLLVEEPPPPPGLRLVVALGAGLRVGLGPVPGLALAPDVSVGIEVERFYVGVHVLGWPEAAAPEGAGVPGAEGVALYALGSSLEIGARLGDQLAVLPAAVIEMSAVVGRGVGVENSRTDVAFACDVGLAATGVWDRGPVRLFLRADLLFALTQPAYVVGDTTAYETPIVRGTGMFGVSFPFGP